MYNRFILSFDPGKNLGYAFIQVEPETKIICSGIIRTKFDVRKNYVKGYNEISNQLGEILKEHIFTASESIFLTTLYVLIEKPSIWATSQKSMANTDGIISIAMQVGGLVEHFKYLPCDFIRLVEPREWKGQLSKKATMARIYRHELIQKNEIKLRDHEADAFGLALWWMGELHKNQKLKKKMPKKKVK